MKSRKMIIIIGLLIVGVIGYTLLQNQEESLIEYSVDELAWLSDHADKNVYYILEGEMPEIIEEIIVTLELLLKLDFVETSDYEIIEAKNGIIFSLNNSDKENDLKTRTITTNKYGIYSKLLGRNSNYKVQRLGVLKSDLIHLDFQSKYSEYNITSVTNKSDMLDLINSDYIQSFLIEGTFPIIIDNQERQYYKVGELYSKDENLIIYLKEDQAILQKILNKNIDYIRKNNILNDIQVSHIVNQQQSVFDRILTEEERNWLLNSKKIVIGVEENAPSLIRNEDKIYGTTIGLLNHIGDLGSVNIEYIFGEKSKLVSEIESYNIDLIWTKERLDVGEESIYFIESNYVAVAINNDIDITSKYDLQQFNVGMVFDSTYTSQLSNELGNINLNYYKDDESLINSLLEHKSELIIMPKATLDYYEIVKGNSELDIRYQFEDSYKSALNIVNNNDTLLSIVNKAILVQDLKLLEKRSFSDIPIEEEFSYSDLLWIIILLAIVILIIVGIIIKVYINHKENHQMNYLFTHDQLTHLPNKYGLKQHVDSLIENETSVAILLIDIDNFKDINDRLGHLYGDQIIVEYSQKLLGVLEKDIILGRSGGDEFVLIALNITEEEIKDLVDEVKYYTDQFQKDKEELYNYSVSIAITTFPGHGSSYDELYKYAEYTLDYAKAEYGANSQLEFTYDIYDNFVQEQKMIKEIKQGIINEEFILYIQPQVQLPDQNIIGGEVLVRWRHPVLGLVFPDKFLPVAEKNGLMRDLDYYILRKSLEKIQEWQSIFDKMKVSVNMSTSTFEDEALVETVKNAIDIYKVNPKWLTIEITEDMGFYNMEKANSVFKSLRELGISVALDDFGKGYSSLAYLERLKFDILKIDKVFIDNIHIKKQSLEIFKTISSLAATMDISIVAEGVELEEQVDIIKEGHGIVVQGYYFSKAMPIDSFVEFVHNKQK